MMLARIRQVRLVLFVSLLQRGLALASNSTDGLTNQSESSEVPCPENSTGANVTSGCLCDAGFDGTIALSKAEPFYSGACLEVACPVNSAGLGVASGCSCDPGCAGYVAASTDAPFYEGACVTVSCPTNSTGVSLADGCMCKQGFEGNITATSEAPFYSGVCLAAAGGMVEDEPVMPTSCEAYCETLYNASGAIIGGDLYVGVRVCHLDTKGLCRTECADSAHCAKTSQGEFTDYGEECLTGNKACCCGRKQSLFEHFASGDALVVGKTNQQSRSSAMVSAFALLCLFGCT